MVNAIAHIHVKPLRLTKQGFVAGGAAAVAACGGLVLGGQPAQRDGRRRPGGGDEREWCLWGWLCEVVLRAADTS